LLSTRSAPDRRRDGRGEHPPRETAYETRSGDHSQ
jgi:hypothetical protein